MDKENSMNKNVSVKKLTRDKKDGTGRGHVTLKNGRTHSKKKKKSDTKLIVFKHDEKGHKDIQKLSETVVLAQNVTDINQVCAVFQENLIVVINKRTVLVLGSVPESLALLQEKSNSFKEHVQKYDIVDLCLSSEAFVIWTESTKQRYTIRKCIETNPFFAELGQYIEDIFRSRSYRIIYFEDLDYRNKEENEQLQSGTKTCSNVSNDTKTMLRNRKNAKVIPRRNNKNNIKVLPIIPERTFICYPFTGTFHFNPIMPTEEVSFPTQVSEQPEPDKDEVVFSNGRSITVGHVSQSLSPRRLQGLANQGHMVHKPEDHETNQSSRSQLGPQGVHTKLPKPPRYPEYVEYHQRLESYARWVKRYPAPTTLCEAGFFYTNEGDTVRCYQCGIGLKDFSFDDNPLKEHARHSGDCPFLQEYIEPGRLATIKSEVLGEDNTNASATTRQGSEIRYRHPEYKSRNARLSSFSKWPQRLMQTPRQLADAGLFYTGFEDNVRCFACDGGLRQWDPEDDPWTEHCRWFPDCPYVREQKGEAYTRLVQATAATEDQVAAGGQATSNIKNGADISNEFERLTLKDPELNAVIAEHRETCLEMGYSEKDFEEAASTLAKGGTIRPTIEEVLDAIEADQQAERSAARQSNVTETPMQENMRLKSMIICMNCGVNGVNALFLPCTHHRVCMECAQLITQCPVCDRHIKQKVRTYMA